MLVSSYDLLTRGPVPACGLGPSGFERTTFGVSVCFMDDFLLPAVEFSLAMFV